MKPDTDHSDFAKILLEDLSSPDLLGLWKQGDERAAQVLSDRYALRMVALVASRLNRRFRDTVDPEDIVQSAFGSFFSAARHSKLQVSQSVSFWHLLATFAKRKMMRSIEQQSAAKRGGDLQRVDLDVGFSTESKSDADDLLTQMHEKLRAELNADSVAEVSDILDRLIAGQTQQDIATALKMNERTLRRRVAKIREVLSTTKPIARSESQFTLTQFSSTSLQRIDYREFVLGKLIGTGGFGKVYRARMQADAALVAVKFLRKGFWQNDDARMGFLREIDQASQIDHPCVIKYLGWGESPHGGPYVVSQWIDAVTLSDRGEVTAEQFLEYLVQICDAVKTIHDSQMIHGDLTPSNILVSKTNQITVTDFGFSQPFQALRKSKNGEDLPMGGTLGFAAPEQISSAFGRIGPATDIYAIGGIAHWYLTGLAPHENDTMQGTLASTLSDSVTIASTSRSEDSEVTAIVGQVAALALKQSVFDRPEQVDQIQNLLRRKDTFQSNQTPSP